METRVVIPTVVGSLICLIAIAEQSAQQPLLSEAATAEERLLEAEAHVRDAPDDPDALAQLGAVYRESNDLDGATRLYLQAARAALQEGSVRFTRELSELFVAQDDVAGLRETFAMFLGTDPGHDSGAYYVALVDFGDGLASLGDDSAWQVFEEALQLGGTGNPEAINRYAQHLMARGMYSECLELVNRLSKEERKRLVIPAYLRYECAKQLELDVTEAGEEINELGLRRSVPFGVVQQMPLRLPDEAEVE